MQKQLFKTTLLFIFFTGIQVIPGRLQAQIYTQTLKGVVLDKALKSPLIGATVALISVDPVRGIATDADGRFRIPNVPVGKHTLRITYLGYKDFTVPNITLNSGKETDVSIEMEESVFESKEVVIKAKVQKQKALNELSVVSARTFSVEETQRFAAAVNDPARMASSFAGVAMNDDGNNTIVIRGNAPNGLLWRMEGVDIPNPNHFSAVGTSGGGISILSAQLLSNSDFLTGAFPSEYGNALSGVFDLKLRKGNSEKREFTFQAGVLGIDAAAEGPLRLGKRNGSFLVNYRYSTLSVISKMGVQIGDATTNFQDLSFNIWMPAGKAGNFTLFGMGGLSDQKLKGEADSLLWLENGDKRYTENFLANTGVLGLTHSVVLGERTGLKTIVAFSGTENAILTDKFLDNYSVRRLEDTRHLQNKWTISSTLNHKINARHLLRAGAYANFLRFNLKQGEWNSEQARLVEELRNEGDATSINTFAQWQYRPSERLTLSGGAHAMFFLLNNTYSIEPRASVKYAFSDRQSLSFGYGEHAQLQALGVYFTQMEENGVIINPNKELGFTKARHFVLSFDQSLPGNWHIKPEIYYQALRQAPVNAAEKDAFSILNVQDGFVNEKLDNQGRGKNYGVELTVEKFLTRGFYIMASAALFEAKYQGSDKVWRDSRFNTKFVNSLVAGKEWDWTRGRKNRTFGVNLKITYMGGLRETPIDLATSIAQGETVRDLNHAFEEKLPAYFRMDTGVRIKRNYRHLATTFSLDIQNTSNRSNFGGRYYDDKTKSVKSYSQAPLIPILAYKLEF
ncbi:MAG: TonB-dependent receptor [Saprospiraceae bacterium]|nr:TonB-dependent receptor [Saprospiraceae bacterium]